MAGMSVAEGMLYGQLLDAERELESAAADCGQRITKEQRRRLAISVLTSDKAMPYVKLVAAERKAEKIEAELF